MNIYNNVIRYMAASFAIFLVMSCGNTEGNGRAGITADWIKEENKLAKKGKNWYKCDI